LPWLTIPGYNVCSTARGRDAGTCS
jgi:hypothetical protein